MPDNFIGKISVEEYDKIPALRSTALKQFLQSPKHYKYGISPAAKEVNDGKTYFALGRLIHCAILEPDQVKKEFIVSNSSSRSTNIYKADVQAAGGRTVILRHEFEDAQQIVRSVTSLEKINQIIASGTPELSATAKLEGVLCKCRMDLFDEKTGMIYDIKTTSESATSFPFVMSRFGYDVSSAFYMDILLANGVDIRGFQMIVVEKNPPFGVMIYEITQEYYNYGRAKYLPALARYRDCLKTDYYPGYDLTPVPLIPPKM